MPRFYKPPSSAAPPISPTPDASWHNTGSVQRVLLAAAKTNTAFATQQVIDATATANRDVLFKQYIYALPTGVRFSTLDTLSGQVLASEAATGNNLRSQIVVRVIASDGTTVRATLYAGDTSTGTSNPTAEWSTTITNARIPRTPPNLAANYVTVAGDYLVIEEGYRKHANASTTGNMRYGDNNASDLNANNSGTADANTWVEFTTSFEPAFGDLIASDDFTGADSAFINYQASGTPDSWDSGAGTGSGFKISTNRAFGDSTAYQLSVHNNDPTSAEYDVRSNFYRRGSGVNSSPGIAARHNRLGTASESMYSFFQTPSTGLTELYKTVAGTWTVLSTTTNASLVPAVGTSKLYELRVRDDRKEAWIDGVLILISTDNVITAANNPGMGQSGAAATLTNGVHQDDWAAQDVVSSEVAFAVPAATASGAGLAPRLAVTTPAAAASGAGLAPRIGVVAPAAAASGAGVAPAVRTSAVAPAAAASGAGLAPRLGLTAPAAAASGAGVAPSVVATLGVPAATGTGAGVAPAMQMIATAPAAAAAAAGIAPTVQIALGIPAAVATGEGIAPDLTTGTPATNFAVPAATASGLGLAPAVFVTASAPAAVASGAGLAPSVRATATTPAATASGAALAPKIGLRPPAAAASGAGIAPAVRTTATTPRALASAAGLAPTLGLRPPAAAATGLGRVPTLRVTATTPAATASGAGIAPAVRMSANAPAATAAGLGRVPTVQIRVAPPAAAATAAGAAVAVPILLPGLRPMFQAWAA